MKLLFVRNQLFTLLAVVGLLLFPSNSGFAQEDLGTLQDLLPPSTDRPTPRSASSRIRLFNNVLQHPLPVWSSVANGPAPAERSRIQTSNKKGLFTLRMVPKEETFEDWKSLFTITSLRSPSGSIDGQGRVVAGQFRAICSPSNLKMFRLRSTADILVQVVACGNFSRARGKGQISAFVILRNRVGEATLTRHWRTDAFQSSIQSTWPIKKAEIDGVLRELARSKLIPLVKQ